ncbi:phBC6A51 family helix-turn-helix protein [Paenibacillus sp. J5C_2022]|uniref:phBC6A51 family helix-turn-helix protein n=1 Tax=Paenibacillus sp. J5C2022 TaxID=2977129 RepID=UPI0021D213B8|nr:phBC6A51 family helix-turn-helix protein [Paenibacillus sp. J5C2022]MCU6709338.1 phBC6A51 family helix-turn-helix protein [Paenibacillus sp. J5C2022]
MKTLNTEHYAAIRYLALPKSERPTVDEIAAEVGVHRSTIFEWKKDPLFEAELKRQMVRNSTDMLPDLIESLPKIAIRDGNAAMAKLALQINGLLTDKVEVETKGVVDTDIEALRQRIESLKAERKAEGS